MEHGNSELRHFSYLSKGLLGTRVAWQGLLVTVSLAPNVSHHHAVCHPSPLVCSQLSPTPNLSIFPGEEDGLEPKEPKAAARKELSDMDYLKSKVVAAESPSSEESEDEAVNCEGGSEAEEEGSFAAPAQQDREASLAKVCVDWGELRSLGREKVHLGLAHLSCSPFLGGVTSRKDSSAAQRPTYLKFLLAV